MATDWVVRNRGTKKTSSQSYEKGLGVFAKFFKHDGITVVPGNIRATIT